MKDYFSKVASQINQFISTLTPVKKVALVGTFLAVLVGISMVFRWVGDTAYRPLMTNLNPEDSANIIRLLREKKIPFKIDGTGRDVAVPTERVDDLRLELAFQGMPQSGIVGYEVFDKQSLGTTSFIQKINQKRAREGELMRTIGTIKGVRRVRVHLAVPERSTFVEDQKKASASVVVDLELGMTLNEKQVTGVQTLVARAVEGLDISDVVLVDSLGKVLSKNNSDPLAALTASQLEFQQKLERDYEKRAEEILSRVVGEGKVVAKVTAEVDFSRIEENSTQYDADGSAVRSQETRADQMQGTRPMPQGAVGATTNAAGEAPANGSNLIQSGTTKNYGVTNYSVPQTLKKTIHPVGSIKKISVAVVVDGKAVKNAEAEGEKARELASDNSQKVEPWTPEKLKEFESIVISALGIDKKRGDTLEVKNIEFSRFDFDESERRIQADQKKSYFQMIIMYSVIGIAIICFFFFVVRPFIKWLTENTIDNVDTFLPQTIEELERLQKNSVLPQLQESIPTIAESVDPDKVEGEMIKEKVTTLIDSNPHKAALVLKEWIAGKEKKPPAEGEAKA